MRNAPWRMLVGSAMMAFGIASYASHSEPARLAPAQGEETSLIDVVQLTSRFERAGEAYFLPDGQWLMGSGRRSGDGTTQVFAARITLGPDKGCRR